MPEIQEILNTELEELRDNYAVCGFIDCVGNIYPLGSDTKVLSSIFELISRPAVYAAAQSLGYEVVEATVQNHYPDFTLVRESEENEKIAVDVKTTYRRNANNTFSYTLGAYTSFIRIRSKSKNIVFPFDQYSRHLVIGFVYDRTDHNRVGLAQLYSVDQLKNIPLAFENVEFFVHDKWRISSDRAGSGNTTNIGSIKGTIDDFRAGNGPFESEDEFLEYWRGYGRTAAERTNYSNINEFRRFKQRQRLAQ